jgi:hypothetical protein
MRHIACHHPFYATCAARSVARSLALRRERCCAGLTAWVRSGRLATAPR